MSDGRLYVVRQGDCITSIAARFGIDPDTLWGSDDNRELRERRQDPNVLAPGDVVRLPSAPTRRAAIQCSGGSVRYRATIPRCRVSLVLRDANGCALGGADYRLLVNGRVRAEGTTPDSGLVEVQVSATATEVDLEVYGGEESGGFTMTLALGHLDPLAEASGVAGRLAQLGIDVADEPDDDQPGVSRALRVFQVERGIAETGEIDEPTRRAINDATHAGSDRPDL